MTEMRYVADDEVVVKRDDIRMVLTQAALGAKWRPDAPVIDSLREAMRRDA